MTIDYTDISTPSPEAEPYDWDGTDGPSAPPIDLYRPDRVTVQQAAPDLATGQTITMNSTDQPVRIVNKSESGIASRVTMTVLPSANHLGVSARAEDLQQVGTVVAVFPFAFTIWGVATTAPTPVVFTTSDDLWIRPAAGTISVTVLIEQFYAQPASYVP